MIYIPNLLTLARIALVPLIVVLLQERSYTAALLVFIVAGVSDAIDGYIAKRFNAETQLGAILDPLADKALLVSAYVMLAILELIPFWLTVAVVFRDVVIIGGTLVMQFSFGSVTITPLKVSKLNTLLQISYIVLALVTAAFHLDMALALQFGAYLVLLTSIVSGCAYVYIGSVKATQLSSIDSIEHD